jgi:anti-sigma B factor antagonist
MPHEEGDGFEARVERRGATVIVVFAGDLDMAAADAAAEALSQALSEESTTVVVDLQRLHFMDSTGLHCLVRAKRLADESGRRLAVLNGAGPAHRLLALANAETFLEMLDDLDGLNGPHGP